MTDFEVWSPELEALGVVDVYNAVTWERRFYEAGTFEITAPATAGNLQLLDTGQIAVKPDADESGVIYRRYISDTEQGPVVTVSGRFLSHLLHGHIIQQETTLSGNVESIMRNLVSSTVMNSAGADYLPFVRLGTLNGFTDTITSYCNYPDLHDYLSALAQATGIAFRLRLDKADKLMYFETIKGSDRSVAQDTNPQIVFSQDYDNLISAEYEKDYTAEYNAAIARYKGEYGEVVVDYNPENKTGAAKRTVSVTGNCVLTESKEIDTGATQLSLQLLAKNALVNATENFTGSVSLSVQPAYKSDYDLGDTVTVQHTGWNITVNEQIQAVTENYDGTGESVIPTFGSPAPTIADILKNKI